MSTYIPITLSLKVTDEDIDDIIEKELTHDIVSTWCSKIQPSGEYLGADRQQISLGGTLIFVGKDDDDDKYELTKEKLINGIYQYVCEATDYSFMEIDEFAELHIDTTQIDSPDADAIIQYALFGEIIYG